MVEVIVEVLRAEAGVDAVLDRAGSKRLR